MLNTIAAIGKKLTGLALIFNSIVSLISMSNLLTISFLTPNAIQPYFPYITNGMFYWFVVLTAILNIVPAKFIGKVKLKRFMFHHYVYGFLASSISLFMIAFFAPAYLFVLLTPSLGFKTNGFQIMPVYAGVVCVYGGLTLIIDDLRDISRKLENTLDRITSKAMKSGKTLQRLHLLSSLISFYVTSCIAVSSFNRILIVGLVVSQDLTNMVILTSLLITSIWGLRAVKAKMWFAKIYADFNRLESQVKGM